MTAKEILEELRPLGTAGYKKVLTNHGDVYAKDCKL